ncbi:MAG: hypothetical protein MZV64_05605 [Ignavibacteriales bacterium]|nr:hypothetical protein [Ignavibacteriales bacterium]
MIAVMEIINHMIVWKENHAEGILRIEVTLDGLNPVVPIEVYYGDYENGLLYFARYT